MPRASKVSRKAAIVGVDESNEIGKVPNKSRMQLGAESAFNALNDAGLTPKDVDALFIAGPSPYTMAEYLGITPKYTDGTNVGGSSFVIHVEHALAAINAGWIDVALIVHGESGRSSRAFHSEDPNMPSPQYEWPYGFMIAPHGYALACSRYMHEFGQERTFKAMGEIAVATRKWAQLNPKAMMKDPMTMEDYNNSRWISWPFHLLDCCLVTDGGGATVVASAAAARSCRKKPVWVLGSAEGHDHGDGIGQQDDLCSTIARDTGPRALKMAGVTHKDIDLAMVYDSFTYTVLITLESLGFCKRGEGPDFVANQRLAPGGNFPTNTNGGGLSYCHTGMYGMFLLLEAARQLRGECGPRQVKDCKLALVNGTGGTLSSCGTLVLGAD